MRTNDATDTTNIVFFWVYRMQRCDKEIWRKWVIVMWGGDGGWGSLWHMHSGGINSLWSVFMIVPWYPWYPCSHFRPHPLTSEKRNLISARRNFVLGTKSPDHTHFPSAFSPWKIAVLATELELPTCHLSSPYVFTFASLFANAFRVHNCTEIKNRERALYVGQNMLLMAPGKNNPARMKMLI